MADLRLACCTLKRAISNARERLAENARVETYSRHAESLEDKSKRVMEILSKVQAPSTISEASASSDRRITRSVKTPEQNPESSQGDSLEDGSSSGESSALPGELQEAEQLIISADQLLETIYDRIDLLKRADRPQQASMISNTRLPEIKLQQFEGNVLGWDAFWSVFSNTIHKRSDITGVDKYTYLCQSLKGEPLQELAGLQHTETSYEVAIARLKARYDNQKKKVDL